MSFRRGSFLSLGMFYATNRDNWLGRIERRLRSIVSLVDDMLAEICCVDNLGCSEHQGGVQLHILEVV